jgi:hypothetical protein
VLQVFVGRGEHEFVLQLPAVAQQEPDLLALAHFDPVGNEDHLPVQLAHRDLNGLRGLLRVARLAGREIGMAVTDRAGGPVRDI